MWRAGVHLCVPPAVFVAVRRPPSVLPPAQIAAHLWRTHSCSMAAASHAATSVGSGIDDVDMEGAPTSLDPAGSAFSERVVCPGDDVTDFISAHPAMAAAHATGVPTLKLGVGLLACAGERVTATKAGVLTFVKPNRFFVLNAQTRYVAAQGDQVIGIVVDKNADFYRVKLHGSAVAMLPALAFDGASKRNKPSIPVGAPIFARVVSCPKSMDPELSCQGAFRDGA
ncbi:hypothetical protein EON66_07040 [archaeon]|nr:MAG: hypothetical protein EON66_07040 [archaeon]